MCKGYAQMKHEFVLIFELPDKRTDPREHRDSLQSWCRDAAISYGVRGHLALEFHREARSLQEAKTTATRDVLQAVPGAALSELMKNI